MPDEIAAARRAYAEELRFTAHLRSPAVVEAFATVARERFVGSGPWRIKSPMDVDEIEYWSTDDADPRTVYHDVLIALDESRGINNGQPQLWAFLLDQLGIAPGQHLLHLGCGTGYYTAIMAELVGPRGRVSAFEIDPRLCERARVALAPWPQVAVTNVNAATAAFEPVDRIVASAGATHPLPAWLDALRSGGRLLFPMTTDERWGGMLLVSRETAEAFAARVLRTVGFIEFSGARDPDIGRPLGAALARDGGKSIKSLRRDQHPESETCWLHAEGWCISKLQPARTEP